MPYPGWNAKQISQYKAIKSKLVDKMDEDSAQEHAARIVNAQRAVTGVLRKKRV